MTSDLVGQFRTLLEKAQSGEDSYGTALGLMDPADAAYFRLCAIPDQFDAELLRVLAPELDAVAADRLTVSFATLSVVAPVGKRWAIHDTLRQRLFRAWLAADTQTIFAAASARLVEHLGRFAETVEGTKRETAQRRRMFHLYGADPGAGFDEFERLLRKARHELRFAECATLIRLMHQYDPALTADQRSWLGYHEGKLAIDQRAWQHAEELFAKIMAGTATGKLAAAARVRLAQVYGERREWPRAASLLEQALDIARKSRDSAGILPRILHELAAAYRELGEVDLARANLQESIYLAEGQNGWASLASAYNNLGTLHLKQREAREAIPAFEKSLEYLAKDQDRFRAGQVYNNLGIAYAELGEWAKSEQYYEESLKTKSHAGDSLGQAMVLNNLARIRATQNELPEAIAALEKAVAIFNGMDDPYAAAQARHNLGKYLWRAARREDARQMLSEAASAYTSLGKDDEAKRVLDDLAGLDQKKGLPWWAWAALVLCLILLVAVLFIVGE